MNLGYPSQADTRKCSQQAIDSEIKSLEESIRALKLHRNALSPISSLPPEMFYAIFSFLCFSGDPYDPLTRLRVSHVCHQWRETALNLPLFWSHIDFTTLLWAGATEMLVRSKSAPLYLESSVSSHRWWDVHYSRLGKELQAHILRICHLTLSARPALLKCTFRELVSSAPTLEYLSLSSRGTGRGSRKLKISIPTTLFSCSTPRLSCLELRNCDISWKSPLLKGLKYLEIITPFQKARPSLVVWLDALNEMPQLEALTLHSASPISPPLPFNVERAATLPSLTRLDISASVGGCALALAHLDLPVLAWLCVTVIVYDPGSNTVQGVLPYVAQHAHGPQDIQPLQSMLLRNDGSRLDILTWPIPDIDIETHDPPALLGATLPTRMALSFKSETGWHGCDTQPEILDAVMTALPLDGLVTLAAQDLDKPFCGYHAQEFSEPQFWLRHSPQWPLLRRVRLTTSGKRGFVQMLLEDDGGRERPLLPSLTELVLVDSLLSTHWTHGLCDALMKRVEQGVPLQILDLRLYCNARNSSALRLLSEIVVNVLNPVDILGPEEKLDAKGKAMRRMIRLWDRLACGPFLEENHPDDEDEDEYEDDEYEDDDDEG